MIISAMLVQISNLQEETRALRHKDDSDECSQGREETHQNKQSPTVHLELCAEREAPAWKTIQ